jgi:hypothetical protein
VRTVVPIMLGYLLQVPFGFDLPLDWLDTVGQILNVLYALSIRGYLFLLLAGFIVYATGLSDTLAKILVGSGIFIYILGPLATNLMGSLIGLDTISMEGATTAWSELFGLSANEIVSLLIWIGEIVAATCCLAGAILYFTPTSKDLESRGRSLIVRSLILAPLLVFFHVTPWL